jgi:hypothetical protein
MSLQNQPVIAAGINSFGVWVIKKFHCDQIAEKLACASYILSGEEFSSFWSGF